MKVTDNYILFWGGELSNFYYSPFVEDGKLFPTNEHYFMYQKAKFFDDKEAMEKILKADLPKDAKRIGRKVKGFDAEKWGKVSRSFMKDGLRLKFNTYPKLRKLLLSYSDKKKFVECSPYDKVWGIGLSEDDSRAGNKSKWLGTNWLGECLTEIRDEFINQRML